MNEKKVSEKKKVFGDELSGYFLLLNFFLEECSEKNLAEFKKFAQKEFMKEKN